MARYRIQTGYIKDKDVTKFILHFGPSLSYTKIVESSGNLLQLDRQFELNRILHMLKEISKHGEENDN